MESNGSASEEDQRDLTAAHKLGDDLGSIPGCED